MAQKTKEKPAQTSGEGLPVFDPPSWAPSQLVTLYEEHRRNPDLSPGGADGHRFRSVLQALICTPRMEIVWSSLAQYETPQIFPNLLFQATLLALKGPSPEWDGLTPKSREKRLSAIIKLARELREITANTPCEEIDAETIDVLGLDGPDLRFLGQDDSDLQIILSAVESRANDLRDIPPLLKKTKGDYPRRFYLFWKIDQLFRRYCAGEMYEEIAGIAGTVLFGDDPDETIDAETARKSLTQWERDRYAPKSRAD